MYNFRHSVTVRLFFCYETDIIKHTEVWIWSCSRMWYWLRCRWARKYLFPDCVNEIWNRPSYAAWKKAAAIPLALDCKYRKKLLIPKQISDDIKQLSHEICQKHNVIIKYMETDKGHIHYMIETEQQCLLVKSLIWWKVILHIIFGKDIQTIL